MQLTTKIRVFALAVSTTPLWSQPTINGVTVSVTQALVQFTAPASPACTVKVSESTGLSPLVPDVDPALCANADTEAAHLASSTVSGGNNISVLRIGLRKATVALDDLAYSGFYSDRLEDVGGYWSNHQ